MFRQALPIRSVTSSLSISRIANSGIASQCVQLRGNIHFGVLNFHHVAAYSTATLDSKVTKEDSRAVPKESDGGISKKETEKSNEGTLDPNSLFVLSIPITTHRSYIYCNHKQSLLDASQLQTIPWIVKAENKVIGLASTAWGKLRSSERTVNKKIVLGVRKLLNTIPYDENSLRSFPSKTAMIREINGEHLEHVRHVTAELEAKNVPVDQLKPIPVYHPRFQDPQAILAQMHQFRDTLAQHHRKYAVMCAIGVPLSLPFALVPVVPNVPGFYLAYRLYCHVKALMGVRNLSYLLESTHEDISVEDTTHLTFRACPELDIPFLADATFAKVRAEDSDDNERILITTETIDKFVELVGVLHLRDDLHKALGQETARIEKELARDPVV